MKLQDPLQDRCNVSFINSVKRSFLDNIFRNPVGYIGLVWTILRSPMVDAPESSQVCKGFLISPVGRTCDLEFCTDGSFFSMAQTHPNAASISNVERFPEHP